MLLKAATIAKNAGHLGLETRAVKAQTVEGAGTTGPARDASKDSKMAHRLASLQLWTSLCARLVE